MYYTYIISSEKNGKLYIGQNQNLEERLQRHNSGRNVSTRNGGPWILHFQKSFNTRTETKFFEKKLKSFKNRDYLFKFIKSLEVGM